MRMLMVVAVVLTIAMPAGAAVVCQKKSGAMFVRDACKKKETVVDLSQFGAAGPTGPTGGAGADATALWAVVKLDGTLVRGSHVTSTQRLEPQFITTGVGPTAIGDGAYEVIFDRDVTQCAYVATLGVSDAEEVLGRGGASVAARFLETNGVFVQTYDAAAADHDIGFHLAVFCP
jgi:hypothetical protein